MEEAFAALDGLTEVVRAAELRLLVAAGAWTT
jgi:hypothetical protein